MTWRVMPAISEGSPPSRCWSPVRNQFQHFAWLAPLHAARRQAGFKSGRAAFGWSAATYCAHETATRFLKDETARIYAKAFNMSEECLIRGVGEGPAVDPLRASRFDMKRVANNERSKSDPMASANRRLRLAGHLSTTDAYTATGLKRTTQRS